jgi:hypothetical protein
MSNLGPPWLAEVNVAFLINRTLIASTSVVAVIVGLGIGLLEGQFLRQTAPVASRFESELLVVWGMASVILGLSLFEVLFIGFLALNSTIIWGGSTRYAYPTFTYCTSTF